MSTKPKKKMLIADQKEGETREEAEARHESAPTYEIDAEHQRTGPAVDNGKGWEGVETTSPTEKPGRVQRMDAGESLEALNAAEVKRLAESGAFGGKPVKSKADLAKLATSASYRPKLTGAPKIEAPTDADFEEPDPLTKVRMETRAAADPSPTTITQTVQIAGVRLVSVASLEESPLNQRKDFGDLEELAASIGKLGVLQPLLARPAPGKPDAFELVFGHRRLRAAAKAGLREVPVDVRTFSDAEVLEAQLVENLQRKDIHPIEESEGYQRLHTEHGYTVEQIAEKVGKSKRWVYTRIQLGQLGPEGREACLKGDLNPSIAIMIARIPSKKLQAEAVERVVNPKNDTQPLSVRIASDLLRTEYTTELRGAPFNTKDEFLVPEAGACGPCPKRSANNPDLFDDLKRADVCTDIACFKVKAKAAWAEKAEKAKSDGKTVLPPDESKRIYRHGSPTWDSPWVELDGVAADDKKKRTWRELLDGPKVKAEKKPEVFVAQNQAGKPVDLVKRAAALEAIAGTGLAWAEKAADVEEKKAPKSKEDLARENAEAEIRKKVGEDVMARAVESVEKVGGQDHVLRLIAFGLLGSMRADAVADRRGVKDLEAWVKKEKGNKLLALVFELALDDWAQPGWKDYGEELPVLAKAFGLKIEAIEKAIRPTVEAELLFAAGPKKGTCVLCGCVEAKACKGGCAWVDETELICTAHTEKEIEKARKSLEKKAAAA